MSRVTFINFYDVYSIGTRIIASYLDANGHHSQLLFLKTISRMVLSSPVDDPVNYQMVDNGIIKGEQYDINPITNYEYSLALEALETFAPQIIGLSCRSPQKGFVIPFAKRIKHRFPNVLLVAGGFGPTLSPEDYLETVDIVVRGDGEDPMLEIANRMDKGEAFYDILNISYKMDGVVQHNPLRKPERDLSRYPHQKHCTSDVFTIQDNKVSNIDPVPGHQHSTLYGRGCPGTCSYCSGGNWRTVYKDSGHFMPIRRIRTNDDVISELRQAKDRGAQYILFLDEFFVGPTHKLTELFKLYKQHIDLPFFLYVHPKIVKDHQQLFETIVDAGLSVTSIAFQTGCEDFARDYFLRKNDNELLLNVAQAISRYEHIKVTYHFIGNMPLETDEVFQRSLDLVARLPQSRLAKIEYFDFKLFPKSPIASMFPIEDLQKRDNAKWWRNGILLFLRFLQNDHEFSKSQNMESIYKLQAQAVTATADAILRGRYVEVFYETNNPVFQLILQSLSSRPVYIWASEEAFKQHKHLVQDFTIAGFIQDDIVPRLESIDGTPAVSLDSLTHSEPHPILVLNEPENSIEHRNTRVRLALRKGLKNPIV
jgi:radical SAM superfamily enzyme YgiQ (UPF0313 family)